MNLCSTVEPKNLSISCYSLNRNYPELLSNLPTLCNCSTSLFSLSFILSYSYKTSLLFFIANTTSYTCLITTCIQQLSWIDIILYTPIVKMHQCSQAPMYYFVSHWSKIVIGKLCMLYTVTYIFNLRLATGGHNTNYN